MSQREIDPSSGADDQVIPAAASDSWRTWLLTGNRRGPVARRRIGGAHKGLKKILVEGTSNGGERPHPWKDFSGVMVRQAVDEAVNTLPVQQKQVVKLAYFAGLSNREIGEKLGLSAAGVEKRLRQALATVSDYVERGRSAGRRAVQGVIVLLPGRFLGGAMRRASGPAIDHAMHLGVMVGAGAVAAALLAFQAASPAQVTQIDRGGTAAGRAGQAQAVARPFAQTGAQRAATTPQKSAITQAGGSLSQVVSAGSAVLRAPKLPPQPLPIKVPPHIVRLPVLSSLLHLH